MVTVTPHGRLTGSTAHLTPVGVTAVSVRLCAVSHVPLTGPPLWGGFAQNRRESRLTDVRLSTAMLWRGVDGRKLPLPYAAHSRMVAHSRHRTTRSTAVCRLSWRASANADGTPPVKIRSVATPTASGWGWLNARERGRRKVREGEEPLARPPLVERSESHRNSEIHRFIDGAEKFSRR